LKIGRRFGDGAELAFIELVDYNLDQVKAETTEGKAEGKTKKKAAKPKAGKTKKETAAPKKKATAKGRKKKETAEE
jgi:large subunit ribosomal protein L17